MKHILFLPTLVFISLSFHTAAQEQPIFPKGEKLPTDHHVGNIWLKELNETDTILNNNIVVVTFEAGARLNWHSHPGGQIVLITAGTAYYQEKGKSKQIFHKGDVIKSLPNVEHWLAAAPEEGLTCIIISPVQKRKPITNWLTRITDEQYYQPPTAPLQATPLEQTILDLSKTKWRWMEERNIDSLNTLFDKQAVFVHMGGTLSKEQELNVIQTGAIQYKRAEIQEASVRFIDHTAILLNKVRLTALVSGNEVVNSFVVTELYLLRDGRWTLGSMSFTKLLTP